MSKLRSGDAWMPAPEYGRSLTGLTVNLLVLDIGKSLPFHVKVLGARVVYSDPDIAVLRHAQAEWMLHARHTYDAHPLYTLPGGNTCPGVGPELRLHGRDPDAAERIAREQGYEVLACAADKPHRLREVYLVDGDGYLWVPDVPCG